jgi:predicted dehydrogenase
VSVCLPHDLHFPVALRALKAGKNVLVEKPLAMAPGQCQALIDAAQASGVKLGVSHNQVFYAPHAEAKRLIGSGAIGRPVLIRLHLGAIQLIHRIYDTAAILGARPGMPGA